jgi:haloalkane dehalogenase
MEVLRTPDERFRDLVDFPFSPHYINIDDEDGGNLRMHYIDEGASDGELILCMHGQPNWSYSFRKMIVPLAEAGFRVIVPDIVGFGRSDKPTKRSDYTFARHVAWLRSFIEGLDLKNINLIAQDWGGPIALRNVADMPERFARIVVTNTGLGDGTGIPKERTTDLRRLLDETPALPIEEVTKQALGAKDGRPGFFIGSSTVMLTRILILER